MEGENMRILFYALLVLVCSMFTSTVEAGMGFGATVHGANTYVETPSVVIYAAPPVFYYGQQPAGFYESYESYQNGICYEDQCNPKHHKDHRFLDDDND